MRALGISLSAAFVIGQALSATTVTTFDRSGFQSQLAGMNFVQQNFDSLTGLITSVNGVTYMPSMGNALVTSTYLTTTGANGLGSTSAGYFLPSETLTLGFSSPISAFGLDINSFANRSGDYEALVNDGSNSRVQSLMDRFVNHSTGQFVGFEDSSPFTKVTIRGVADRGTGGGNCADAGLCSFTVDSLAFASDPPAPPAAVSGQLAPPPTNSSAVPETSTFVMLGLGISAAGLLGRRRTK